MACVGPMFKIYTCNRSTIAAVNPAGLEPHVLISITSPDDPPAQLRVNSATRCVLRLSFHDLPWSDEEASRRGWSSCMYDPVQLFTRRMAEDIWMVVESFRVNVVVHCYAGVSRSGAVAVALKQWYGGIIVAQNPPVPNTRVLEIMRETRPRKE